MASHSAHLSQFQRNLLLRMAKTVEDSRMIRTLSFSVWLAILCVTWVRPGTWFLKKVDSFVH